MKRMTARLSNEHGELTTQRSPDPHIGNSMLTSEPFSPVQGVTQEPKVMFKDGELTWLNDDLKSPLNRLMMNTTQNKFKVFNRMRKSAQLPSNRRT